MRCIGTPRKRSKYRFLASVSTGQVHASPRKILSRHIWERYKEQVDANRLTELGRRLYARRKETVERSFADAKQLHGHRYARFRGLSRVQAQCLLCAACQNMKKIALLLARKARAAKTRFLCLIRSICAHCVPNRGRTAQGYVPAAPPSCFVC